MQRADVLAMSNPRLRATLRAGEPIEARALDDTAYRGVSLGLPRFVERLTWKTFQKTFHRDPASGALRGWNVRVEQRGLDAATVARTRRGVDWTFGHYQVVSAAGYKNPWPVNQALMIDYQIGGNSRWDPMNWVKDPLVAINAGSVELLLGWSYVDLGFLQLSTPTFFLLEREGALTSLVAPPAQRRLSSG